MCPSTATRPTSARTVGVLALTVFALGILASSAWAVSAMAATSLSAPQGGTITISGNVSVTGSCPASAPVQLTSTPTAGDTNLFPGGLGPQAPRDAGGTFHATFVIPASTPVGSYTIGIRCGGYEVSGCEILQVTAGPHVAPSIAVSPASVQPGGGVTISGVVPVAGTVFCPSGTATQLTSNAALFPPDGLGPKITRDAAGNFRTTYTVPGTTALGTYTITVRCGGGNVGIQANLQVGTAPTTTMEPATTTTSTTTPAGVSSTTTSLAPTAASTSTIPATTTAPTTASKTSNSSPSNLRWVALGALVVVVLAVGLFVSRRRRA
jgi:hypothetical protein